MATWEQQLGSRQGEKRVEGGWRLARAAWRLLRSERPVFLLALGVAACMVALVVGSFFVSYSLGAGARSGDVVFSRLLAIAAFTLASTFVHVALVAAADAAIDGSRISAADALAEARMLLGPILTWVLIDIVVWVALEVALLASGAPILLFVACFFTWLFATIFVVPVIAVECANAGEALGVSARLACRRWGEILGGSIGIGFMTWLALIPAGILIGAGISQHENHPHPGSGLALVLLGLCVGAITAGFSAATNSIFSLALYRDALGTLPGSDYVAKRRKSWVLRICGGVALLLIVLGVVAALTRPDHPASRDESYWHFSYYAAEPARVEAGAPVLYRHRQIGVVVASDIEDGEVIVSFEVAPEAWDLVESHTMYVGGRSSHHFLGVGRENGAGSQDHGRKARFSEEKT